MPFWMKRVFVDILPKMLMIERPAAAAHKDRIFGRGKKMLSRIEKYGVEHLKAGLKIKKAKPLLAKHVLGHEVTVSEVRQYPKSILDALHGIQYIKAKMKEDRNEQVVRNQAVSFCLKNSDFNWYLFGFKES